MAQDVNVYCRVKVTCFFCLFLWPSRLNRADSGMVRRDIIRTGG